MIVQMTEMPEEAILICELAPPYEAMADPKALGAAAHKFYKQVNKPISLILLTSEGKNIHLSFSDAMIGIGILTRGEYALNTMSVTLYNVTEVMTPPVKIVLEAIAKGLYGGITVKIAKSKDEALTLIRAGK
jgi:hypothetical protein